MDIESEILKLEKAVGGVPGTQVTRVFALSGEGEWCLSVGRMHEPKQFFRAATIKECIDQAMSAVQGRVA